MIRKIKRFFVKLRLCLGYDRCWEHPASTKLYCHECRAKRVENRHKIEREREIAVRTLEEKLEETE